jgi:hypothetical protein
MFTEGPGSLTPHAVFLERDWLKMSRIYTRRIAAEMIQRHSKWNWPNKIGIDKTMGQGKAICT